MLVKIATSMALWAFIALVHAQGLDSCPVGGDASIVANAGTSVGTEQVFDGGTLA